MSISILVVDDNRDILENIRDYLALRDRRVETATTGSDALERIRREHFDLIVLDVGLPGIDGLMLCKMIRNEGFAAPIIMLTARDTIDDRVEGLECGADDYVVKPFSLRELSARIDAHLRRAGGGEAGVLRVGELTMNLSTMRVERAGVEIKLNPSCWRLLRELMTRSPAVVDRARLEQVLWNGSAPESDALRSTLYLLRRQLDKPFAYPMLKTHTGLGWSVSDADKHRALEPAELSAQSESSERGR